MSENLYQGESLMSKFKTKKWTLLYKEISKLGEGGKLMFILWRITSQGANMH